MAIDFRHRAYDSLRLTHTLALHGLAAGVLIFALVRRTGSVQGQNLIIAAWTALFFVGLAVDMSQYAGLGSQSTMVGSRIAWSSTPFSRPSLRR